MQNKLSTKQIKMIATMHCAINLVSVDDFMFDDDCDITDKEREKILTEIKKIAGKLSKGYAMNLGSTTQIIEAVRKKFPSKQI